jgi:hypothetical protein
VLRAPVLSAPVATTLLSSLHDAIAYVVEGEGRLREKFIVSGPGKRWDAAAFSERTGATLASLPFIVRLLEPLLSSFRAGDGGSGRVAVSSLFSVLCGTDAEAVALQGQIVTTVFYLQFCSLAVVAGAARSAFQAIQPDAMARAFQDSLRFPVAEQLAALPAAAPLVVVGAPEWQRSYAEAAPSPSPCAR